jgi:hypothetical protein
MLMVASKVEKVLPGETQSVQPRLAEKQFLFDSGKESEILAVYDVIKRLLNRYPAEFVWAMAKPPLQHAFD